MADDNYLASVDSRLQDLSKEVSDIGKTLSALVRIEGTQMKLVDEVAQHSREIEQLKKAVGPVVWAKRIARALIIIAFTAAVTTAVNVYLTNKFGGLPDGKDHDREPKELEVRKAPVSKGTRN